MKVYELRCKVFGEKHPATLTTLNNISYTYEQLGEYEKALEIEERVYESRKEVLGEDHPQTIKAKEKVERLRKIVNPED